MNAANDHGAPLVSIAVACDECSAPIEAPAVFRDLPAGLEALCLAGCATRRGWPWITKRGQQHEMPL